MEVLRRAAKQPFGGELVLVSPHTEHFYSAMLPAQLRGDVSDAAIAIDLRALCLEANARFVQSEAIRIEGSRDGAVVHTVSEPVSGDACSLDIGSESAGLDIPGVRAFAFPVRPHTRWLALVKLVREVMRSGANTPFAVTVVGGGAGSVELVLALVARARSAGQNVQCTLVCGTEGLTEDLGPRFASRARGVLESRGVTVLTGQRVISVAADHVILEKGARLDSALTLWVTGPAAPPLLRKSGLPVDEEGFLRVDATLRAVNGDAVFGAGDCITLVESPWAAKSLVYARRAAPVLADNLRTVMHGPAGEPRLYDAPQRTMSILDTSDGKALLYWQGWTVYSKWALSLKRQLDVRCVERYRVR